MRTFVTAIALVVVAAGVFYFGRLTATPSRAEVTIVPPAAPEAAEPASAEPLEAAVPVQAEIAKVTAEEAMKQKRYDAALQAAMLAVNLAPEWAEAYAARANAYLALATTQPQAIPNFSNTFWSGMTDGTSVQVRLLGNGRFECEGDICAEAEGRWSADGGSVQLAYDDGDTVEEASLEGGRLVGHGRLRSGGGRYPLSWASKDVKLLSKDEYEKVEKWLRAATDDFETYLKLNPQAPDRATVILSIAQLKVRAAAVREAKARL